MNPKKKPKLKELIKNVKKMEDGQFNNIVELIYRIFFKRH